jgi:hypothetical protein
MATLVIFLLGFASRLGADEVDLFATRVGGEDGWENPGRAAGTSCRQPCDCDASDSAFNRSENPWLRATDFQAFSAAQGHIVRVEADALCRYDSGTTGRIELRVVIPSLDIDHRVRSPRFSSNDGRCAWRMREGGDITALVPVWTPEVLNEVRLNVRRVERSNSTPLRVKAFRLRVTTEPLPCEVAVSPTAISVGAERSSISFTVTPTHAGCTWTAESSADWIAPPPDRAFVRGQGTAAASFVAGANPGAFAREADIVVQSGGSEARLHVVQAGAECVLRVTPAELEFSRAGGSAAYTVSVPLGCPWRLVGALPPWASAPRGTSGIGGGRLEVSVAPNNAPEPRRVVLEIVTDLNGHRETRSIALAQTATSCADETVVVPAEIPASADGAVFPVRVTQPADCCSSPRRLSGASWISFRGTSGSCGNGDFDVVVDPNPSRLPRAEVVEVGPASISVMQAGRDCVYALFPSSIRETPEGGSTVVRVEAPLDCGWRVEEASGFVSLDGDTNDSGNGSFEVRVEENEAVARRTAEVRLIGDGGQVVSLPVSQSADPCPIRVSPSPASLPSGRVRFSLQVTANRTCAWSARTATPWLTILSGQSGAGSGTVVLEAVSTCRFRPPSDVGRVFITGIDVVEILVHQPSIPFCTSSGAPVSVKVLADEAASRPAAGFFTSDGQVEQAVFEANEVLAANGVGWELYLDEVVTLAAPEFLSLEGEASLAELEADTALYPEDFAFRDDAINVYVVDSYDASCSGCSPVNALSPDGRFLVVSSQQGLVNDGAGWLREVARYLGLREVFPCGDPECVPFECPIFAVEHPSDRGTVVCDDVCPPDGNALLSGRVAVADAWLSPCQVAELNYLVLDPEGAFHRLAREPEAGAAAPFANLRFRRGDANADQALNISDAIAILGYLFAGGFVPCQAAADATGDARIDISDPIRILGHLFLGGEPGIAPPGPGYCAAEPYGELPCEYDSSGCPAAEAPTGS